MTRYRYIVVWLCVLAQLSVGLGSASAAVLCVASDHIAVETAHFPLPCKSAHRSTRCTDTPLFIATQDRNLSASSVLVPPTLAAFLTPDALLAKARFVPRSNAAARARDPVLDALASTVLLI